MESRTDTSSALSYSFHPDTEDRSVKENSLRLIENGKHGNLSPTDDPATIAAGEELKQTTLSDKSFVGSQSVEYLKVAGTEDEKDPTQIIHQKVSSSQLAIDGKPKENPTGNGISLVKKRSRDQDEEPKDQNINVLSEPGHTDEGVGNGNRTTRSEPEKKRPRDASQDRLSENSSEVKTLTSVEAPEIKSNARINKNEESIKPPTETVTTETLKSSTISFANSSFASLANSTISPFGCLGASKNSIFSCSSNGDEKKIVSDATDNLSFSSKTNSASKNNFVRDLNDNDSASLSFSSGIKSSFSTPTNGIVFGSSLGAGFASSVGPKLSSFAAPESKSPPHGTKLLKAFGAPESDEDEEIGQKSNEGCPCAEGEESATARIEKKNKTTKVHVDDGEAEEATLLQIRAKLFALESKEAGWKERGIGTLKVNAPKTCVSYDENGSVISGSFQFSGVVNEAKEPTTSCVARLIMRQENTHRVVLNTVILRSMTFENKNAASSSQFVFTALEGEKELKPIMMLLKLSEANAKLLKSEIDSIKNQL